MLRNPIDQMLTDAERLARQGGNRDLVYDLLLCALDTAQAERPTVLMRARLPRLLLGHPEAGGEPGPITVTSPSSSSGAIHERGELPFPVRPLPDIVLQLATPAHEPSRERDAPPSLSGHPPLPLPRAAATVPVAASPRPAPKSGPVTWPGVIAAVALVAAIAALPALWDAPSLTAGLGELARPILPGLGSPAERAERAWERGDHLRAREEAEVAIASGREAPRALWIRAMVALAASDTAAAVRDLSRAAATDEGWEVKRRSARELARLPEGRTAAADAYYEAVARGLPSAYWEEAAVALEAAGQTDKAHNLRALPR